MLISNFLFKLFFSVMLRKTVFVTHTYTAEYRDS